MLNAKFKFILLFILFLGVFLLNTQYTDADIFAERNVRNNSFRAASINFFVKNSVNNASLENLYKTIGIVPQGYDFGAVKVKRDGGIALKYILRTVKTNGDGNFCNGLSLQVLKRNLTSVYNGSLMNLSLEATLTDDNVTDWIFLVGLDDSGSELKNKICEFNIEFKTYRNNPTENSGIFARRILTNVISSGAW